jgi:hypothetical protein
MNSLVLHDHPGTNLRSSSQFGDGGGDVEDILKRLGHVESDVSDLKSDVSTIRATLPHLATQSDVAELRAEMAEGFGALRSEMTGMVGALRSEMTGAFGLLRTEMAARETAFIKWMIATVLAVAGVAFTIAKFVH